MNRSVYYGPIAYSSNSLDRAQNPSETGQAQLKMTQQTQTVNLKWTKAIRTIAIEQSPVNDQCFPVNNKEVFNIRYGDIIYVKKRSPNDTGLQEAYNVLNGELTYGSSEELLENIVVFGIAVTELIYENAGANEVISVYVGGTMEIYNNAPISPGFDARITLPYYDSKIRPDAKWILEHYGRSNGAIKLRLEALLAYPLKGMTPTHIFRAINRNDKQSGSYEFRANLSKTKTFLPKEEKLRLAVEGPLFKGFFSLLGPLVLNDSVVVVTLSKRLCDIISEAIMLHATDTLLSKYHTIIQKLNDLPLETRTKSEISEKIDILADAGESQSSKKDASKHLYSFITRYTEKHDTKDWFRGGGDGIFSRRMSVLDAKKDLSQTARNKVAMALLARDLGFIGSHTDNNAPSMESVAKEATEIFVMNQTGSKASCAFGHGGHILTKSLENTMRTGFDDWLRPMTTIMNANRRGKLGRIVEQKGGQRIVIKVDMSGSNE